MPQSVGFLSFSKVTCPERHFFSKISTAAEEALVVMSQPDTAIALGSDTESEDGLREQLAATAAATNDESDGDDALLRTPVRLAVKADPQTPETRAPRLPATPAKRKDPPPRLPPLDDGEDSDGAQASTVAGVCPLRAAEQAPIKSPIGSPGRGAPSGAARRREARDAALPSLNDGEDSDGAQASSAADGYQPCAAERAPMKPPTGSPGQGASSGAAPSALSGAARRRLAHAAVPAAHVSGLEEVIQGLRDLAGAVDPFVVDQTAWERSVILLEGAVQRSSLASVRHTPGISRVAKWTGLEDPTGVVMSLLRAFDAAFDELDVVSMQMALDRLNEHPSAAHGRFSAEKSFMKTTVTNARKLHRGFAEEHMGYAAQGALGLYDSGHATLSQAVARNLLHVLRAGVADTILIESLRSDASPSPSVGGAEQPTWHEYLRDLGIDGASDLEREVAYKVTASLTADQMKITRLFELFLTERTSSVVLGMSGVGKTYMAPVWKLIANLKGKRIYFVGPNLEARS
jgi:hypothetical protein